MSVKTIAYARDNAGALAAFFIDEAASYEAAIDAVKADLGVNRALCLVLNENKKAEQPIKEKEVA